MATVITRAESICEEFTDWVLYDDIHQSIIFNVHVDHFPLLHKELKKLKFLLVHFTKLEELDTATCVYKRI